MGRVMSPRCINATKDRDSEDFCPSWNVYRIYRRAPTGKGYQPIGWTCDMCQAIWKDEQVAGQIPIPETAYS